MITSPSGVGAVGRFDGVIDEARVWITAAPPVRSLRTRTTN